MPEIPDNLTVQPSRPLRGRLRVPGDKSISHRALILGAIADGRTSIRGLLASRDIDATRRCLEALGVAIEERGGTVYVDGAGRDGLRESAATLDCGNSGTTMRLLAGVLAGQPFVSRLSGDASLSRRPMDRIAEPLEAMGAAVVTGDQGRPPLEIRGRRPLSGVNHASPVASAQVKSCLLLAGLYADGRTQVTEPAPSRDHTERMLEAFGCPVDRLGNRVAVNGGTRLNATDLMVPGDASAAAFLAVAATLVPRSDVVLEGVGINPTRAGFIHVLHQMGADIAVVDEREEGGEPVADLRVRHARLDGTVIDPAWVASAIDEFPALFVAAAAATGHTTISGAVELRVKESDRIAVMARSLAALGVSVTERPDGMELDGGGLSGGEVDAEGDHRCAMALMVAALVADGPVRIAGAGGIATSYPGFEADIGRLAAPGGGSG